VLRDSADAFRLIGSGCGSNRRRVATLIAQLSRLRCHNGCDWLLAEAAHSCPRR
jgi:hypothetical protein